MNRAIFGLILATMLMAGCGPAPVQQVKVDPASEPWYAAAVERLTTIDHTADQLLQSGRNQDAAAIVTAGQSLQSRLLSAPRPTLAAMEAIADLDHVYGRLLVANGYFGEARLLFQKNVTRWKTWKPQSPETESRLKQANQDIAECDRHMGA